MDREPPITAAFVVPPLLLLLLAALTSGDWLLWAILALAILPLPFATIPALRRRAASIATAAELVATDHDDAGDHADPAGDA